MERLPRNVINDMADRFAVLTTDPPRQQIVDELGHHPVNHALFGYRLAKYAHPNDLQVYLALTKYID